MGAKRRITSQPRLLTIRLQELWGAALIYRSGKYTASAAANQIFPFGYHTEEVTSIIKGYLVYHDNKIERLKLFLHCCYSVARGQRAIRINNKWNFISTRMIVRRNNNIDKGSAAGLYPPSFIEGAVSRTKSRPDSRPTERR
jgi:hypothetical protein